MIQQNMRLHKRAENAQQHTFNVPSMLCVIKLFRNGKPYSKQYTRSCIKLLG